MIRYGYIFFATKIDISLYFCNQWRRKISIHNSQLANSKPFAQQKLYLGAPNKTFAKRNKTSHSRVTN